MYQHSPCLCCASGLQEKRKSGNMVSALHIIPAVTPQTQRAPVCWKHHLEENQLEMFSLPATTFQLWLLRGEEKGF